MPDTDIAIIGAGAAGLSVAAIAASLGFRTTLIERGAMGGDCLNTGCVPSKALLAVAHLAAEARRAPRYGVVVPPPEIDWALVQAHVRSAIAKIAPHDSEERFRAMGVEVLRATGRFTGRDSLDVGGRRLVFRRAVIAAGSHAVLPPIPGLGLVPFLTHETIFDLLTCPQHLLVLGGGPIGLEMALAHRRLGARVTLVEQAQIASREDPECVDVLRAALLPLAAQIETAFVYGSVAKQQDTAGSDIDLMVVADGLSYSVLFERLAPVEQQLGRKINPTLYTAAEFQTRRLRDNHFLKRVLEQTPIELRGTLHDIPQTNNGTPAEPGKDPADQI